MKSKVWGAVCFIACCGFLPQSHAQEDVAEGVRLWVHYGTNSLGGYTIHNQKTMLAFYSAREFQPVWQDPRGWRLFKQLQYALSRASEHGLLYEDYHFRFLSDINATRDPLLLELLATDAYLLYADHLAHGKVRMINSSWRIRRARENIAEVFSKAIENENIAVSLEQLAPQDARYQSMQRLMKQILSQEEISIPVLPGMDYKEGSQGPAVNGIRAVLAREGDLASVAPSSDVAVFDSGLSAAVMRFQNRHGLPSTGTVDTATLIELTRPKRQRFLSVAVNMERMRWLPHELGARYLHVNPADFNLAIIEDSRVVKKIQVIVGRLDRQTPLVSAPLRHFIINPYWQVPQSIAEKDIWKWALNNPARLQQRGFDVIDSANRVLAWNDLSWGSVKQSPKAYRLQQKPGVLNALGKVKFVFPNSAGIYLHDTPDKALFNKKQRTESSGCIRVSEPHWLMLWLSQYQKKYTAQQLIELWKKPDTVKVDLDTSIPVFVMYWTVWPEQETMQWRRDVYHSDQEIATLLFTRQDGGMPENLYP